MKAKCKELVPGDMRFPRFRRCSRDAVSDGYCTQHHPSVIARRQKKRDERYEAKMSREMALIRDAHKWRRLKDPALIEQAVQRWLKQNQRLPDYDCEDYIDARGVRRLLEQFIQSAEKSE